MSVVKNKSTPESKAFWDHVEAVAAQVRCECLHKNMHRKIQHLPQCPQAKTPLGDKIDKA